MQIQNAQLALQEVKLALPEGFCENVSGLMFGSDVCQCEYAFFKFLLNKMTVNFNMFCSLMEHKILSNVQCSLTVTVKLHRR